VDPESLRRLAGARCLSQAWAAAISRDRRSRRAPTTKPSPARVS